MDRPRILLAEDNREMRERVEKLLGPHYEIVDSVANGEEAIHSVLNHIPDVLVTDISMPVLNGIQLASHVRDAGCPARVVFLTIHDDDDYVETAFETGALGYVLKPRLDYDLIPAIQAALQGEKFLSHSAGTVLG